MPKKKIHGKEPKTSPLSLLSREEKEERRKKSDPRPPQDKGLLGPKPVGFKGGGIAAGMRRFNRGGKV